MIFGDTNDFAIEVYHEPFGPQWGGFGRLCIHTQGMCLGDIRDNHCSLFDVTDRFRELAGIIHSLWDISFAGLSDAEVFGLIDRELYTGEASASVPSYASFDFLTNTGEIFDGTKTFIVCQPPGYVHIMFRLRDDTLGSASCSVQSFRSVADAYVRWFDEQVLATAPPFSPINPFDPNETVPDN
ncbi:MAG: hypothetical protein ACKVY0_28735 [Prosthecobacter sp.]|uniref:hypothetical protein n=1 Tax=Prosthecobacter sp. TaxID=1965333 RepID=UPI0038FEEDB3